MKLKELRTIIREEIQALHELRNREFLVASTRTNINLTKPKENKYYKDINTYFLLKKKYDEKFMIVGGHSTPRDKGNQKLLDLFKEYEDQGITIRVGSATKGEWVLGAPEAVKRTQLDTFLKYTNKKTIGLYVFK